MNQKKLAIKIAIHEEIENLLKEVEFRTKRIKILSDELIL